MRIDEISILLEPEPSKAVRTHKNSLAWLPLRKSIPLKVFSSTLARLLQAGVPILRAFQVLEKGAKSPELKKAVMKIREDIGHGQSLSAALQSMPHLFPVYFVQMIRAGEVSGTVDLSLDEISRHLEKQEMMKRKLREALTYPSFIIAMGIVTVLVLLKIVVPRVSALYADFGGELPKITQIILSLSHLFIPIVIALILSTAVLIFSFFNYKDRFLSALSSVPIIRSVISKNLLYQFSSLLSLLLKSGIPILEAMDVVEKTSSFAFFQNDLRRFKESLAQGDGLANAMKGTFWAGEESQAMILSGEESGKLPETLAAIAKDTELEIDAMTQFFIKVLEPAMIVIVGVLAAFIVIGALLPIFDLNMLVR